MTGLEDLPVELLYEVQLSALSAALPITSQRLHAIFTAAPPSYRAQYMLSHIEPGPARLEDAVSKILRFPLCSVPVLDAVLRSWPAAAPAEEPPGPPSPSAAEMKAEPELVPTLPAAARAPELPKHLFQYTVADAPMPLLRYLYAAPRLAPPDANSHDGYALTRAVHAGFRPLVRLLLDHGASPVRKGGLAVLVAIRQKNLPLVRMLVERAEADAPGGKSKGRNKNKRRRLEDRMEVTPEMLKAAVKAKARDIAEYLMQEKGCVPDIQTLHMLMR
ncbi:hypothetical protein B0H11DRAFT_2155969 [Mycena galericulata]|nr:hypothetical protein B0H11DRAFT_2155969 [Mycena galericulata]